MRPKLTVVSRPPNLVVDLAGRLLPVPVRSFVRGREIGLVLAALVIGAGSGGLVLLISAAVQFCHDVLFGLPGGIRLSGAIGINHWRAMVMPAAGGCVLAALSYAARPLAGRLADAMEANALYGGRLSVRGSLLVTVQTILSCGFGASVGLEAGYAQICSALGSRLGQALAARRADMRLLVACGAAGAIAGAFNAPLAGAFYGFEVVLGTYTVGTLAPVAASALVASLVTREWSDATYLIRPGSLDAIGAADLAHIAAIGVICGVAGIALMRGVGLSEAVFARLPIPLRTRPIAGGLVVGGLSWLSPQVLGAGHGALTVDLFAFMTPWTIISLILLKGTASAISLGSGFRGGLFYASLLLGALVGRLYVDLVWRIHPSLGFDADLAALTGMAAFGTSVIGAPVTMTALALETTGNFPITIAALIASAIASAIVREFFGYSFATWRFHLRGEAIRGPHDVGWMHDLAVRKLMRADVKTTPATCTVAQARVQFPLGSLKNFAVVETGDRYVGMVTLDDLFTTLLDATMPVTALMRHGDTLLFPWMTVRQALDVFETAESDALIVVDHPATRHIVGVLSESNALRSYGRELERQNPDSILRTDPMTEPARPA